MQWNSCFISVGVQTVLRILAIIKNLEQYNKSPLGKFVKKKKNSCKIFCSKLIFLELQCLVDDLVDFWELSIVINVSLP